MRRQVMALALLLVARLALGVAYSVATPLGEAPDEADHYAYAAYIGREGRLPTGFSMTQSKHPPLYHLLAAAAAPFATMDTAFLRSNPDAGLAPGAPPNFFVHTTLESWPWQGGALAMHLGRLVSVLAGVGLVLATHALGRRVWPARPDLSLAAAAVVAFLPESLFIAGSMSNDTLAALWSTLGLWAGLAPAAPRRRHWPAVLAAGIFMGLAFVTKASTVGLWPVIVLALWLVRSRGDLRDRGAWADAALAGVVAVLIAAPWLLRNWRLYGDPMGTRLMLATIDRRVGPLTPADLWWLARGWFFSFWGRFGAAGHLPLPWPFYAVWAGLLLAAAAGWLRRLLGWVAGSTAERVNTRLRANTRPWAPTDTGRANRAAAIVVLAGAPLMAVLAIVSYSQVALGTDQGRLLFPAIAPLALLLAGGIAAWLPANQRAEAAGFAAAVPVGADVRPATVVEAGHREIAVLEAPAPDRHAAQAGAPGARIAAAGEAGEDASATRTGATRPDAIQPGLGRGTAAEAAGEAGAAGRGNDGSPWLAAGLGGLMAVLALLALIVGIVLPYAPPLAPDAAGLAAVQPLGQTFGRDLALTGLRWGEGGPAAAAPTLTLYWQAVNPPAADLRTDLRVVDQAGNLAWEWKRSPGDGRFSTDRWPVGRTVADVYHIPVEALRRGVRVEVGLRAFPSGPWLPPAAGSAAAPYLTLWEAGQ